MARGRAQWGALALLCVLSGRTPERGAAQPPWPSSGSLERMIAQGQASMNAGDSISAISYLRDGVARAPRDPRGYAALGNAYLHVREPKSALEVFEAGERNTRGSLELSLGLADTYARLGKSERAISVLRQVASSGETSPALYRALAEQAETQGAFSEALAARRAVLWQLRAQHAGADDQLRDARTRVAALELVLGQADRLSHEHCAEHASSPVLRVLRGCEPTPAETLRNSLP